jgi:hypothetical protein
MKAALFQGRHWRESSAILAALVFVRGMRVKSHARLSEVERHGRSPFIKGIKRIWKAYGRF